jgi:hypothetical protein
MTPQSTKEITQLTAMLQTFAHITIFGPLAINQAQISQPTTEFVIETGVFKYVARFTQMAPQIKVASIASITSRVCSELVSIISFFIV